MDSNLPLGGYLAVTGTVTWLSLERRRMAAWFGDAGDEAAAPSDARELAELSQEFLASVKRCTDTARYREALAAVDEATVAALTDDPDAATAFWVNCYNAVVQDALAADPAVYDDRRQFFGSPRLTVAGTELSLDDVEHGLLRSSKWKYGLGYVPRLFPDEFERRHRLPAVDPRIHFALNCGAESCPPILAYTADGVDQELDTATRSFLEQSSAYERDAGRVTVSRLFLYYRDDFGGRSGIYEFLERYGVVPGGERPRVRYDEYDWTRRVGAFREVE
jgi:hypothetical protein